MNILITGQFDRNSANIAKLCARAFEQGPISFRRVLEKFGGSNSQKYMSCSGLFVFFKKRIVLP